MRRPTRVNKIRPLIALTMGDAAGVGPEIIAGAWPETVVHDWCRPVVIGHPEIMRRAVALWQTDVRVVEIDSVADARPELGVIPCIRCCRDDVLDVPPGQIDARTGQAAFDAVVKAGALALAGEVDAITTAPLHKKALRQAGHPHPGHTELLAEICGVPNVEQFAMMLYLAPSEDVLGPGGLAVVHTTLHTSMANALKELTVEAVLGKARLADQFMTRLMGSQPHIAACAFNPHA
ncbi:MAG: 4-hydroxythreonine-4-phosphate dehydrogenase PdxA, partial [Patescibacteria group bacterium]|nr:4-hydroxythreonine-4-phosphate dehydrogenase PdxA [Patescibacteria group bacterium]